MVPHTAPEMSLGPHGESPQGLGRQAWLEGKGLNLLLYR